MATRAKIGKEWNKSSQQLLTELVFASEELGGMDLEGEVSRIVTRQDGCATDQRTIRRP